MPFVSPLITLAPCYTYTTSGVLLLLPKHQCERLCLAYDQLVHCSINLLQSRTTAPVNGDAHPPAGVLTDEHDVASRRHMVNFRPVIFLLSSSCRVAVQRVGDAAQGPPVTLQLLLIEGLRLRTAAWALPLAQACCC